MNDLVTAVSRELSSPKFFHFSQNNTGGSFNLDEQAGITHNVIVEALNAADANHRAEEIGLYFDGYGDCECCGNRWYEQWDDKEGSSVPSIYGEPVEAQVTMMAWMPPGKETVVHYLDGRREWFGVFTRTKKK